MSASEGYNRHRAAARNWSKVTHERRTRRLLQVNASYDAVSFVYARSYLRALTAQLSVAGIGDFHASLYGVRELYRAVIESGNCCIRVLDYGCATA